MPKDHTPSVFVSSTCYDLGQVRAEVKKFLESLGLTPVLSEYSSFPLDPDIGTVENCLKVVDSRADIYVLIVGGRYGSLTNEGKSITNLEYLRARAKGIPIYAFVLKSVLDVLPEWRKNPQRSYLHLVDSAKLFEFVDALKESGDLWIFPFETARDIASTLRTQLAFLFMDSLHLRTKARAVGLSESISQLRGEALRLAIEKPMLWEARLFAQVLSDEIQASKSLRQDLDYRLVFGEIKRIDNRRELVQLLRDRMPQLEMVGPSLETLFNTTLQEAMGPPGQPGDPEKLAYVARKIADAYRSAIMWKMEFQRLKVPVDFQGLSLAVAELATNMIREIEMYSDKLKSGLEEAIASHKPGEKKEIEFVLHLTADSSALKREATRLQNQPFSLWRLFGL